MKVVTLLAVMILITGVMVIYLPDMIRITQPTHTISSGLTKVGNIFRSVHLPDIAEKIYDSSLSIDPGNFDTLVDKGDFLTAQGKDIEALTSYSRSLSLKPDSISLMKKKSDVLKRLGRTDEATTLLKSIASVQPENPSDQLTIVHSLMDAGNYREAVDKTDEILKNQPNNADLWETRGDILLALATTDTTLNDQLKNLQTNGKSSDTTVKSTLTRNQAYMDGISSYRKAILLDPLRSSEIGEKMVNSAQGFGIIMKSGDLLNEVK